MKYVVLTRDNNNDGCICGSYGVFKRKSNAKKKLDEINDGNPNIEFCIEEVDPYGSFADDDCVD